MPMATIKWRDAYSATDTSLEGVVKELGTVAIATTHGNVVHEDKDYVVVEQHNADDCEDGNDYTIIPKPLILRRENVGRKVKKRRRK